MTSGRGCCQRFPTLPIRLSHLPSSEVLALADEGLLSPIADLRTLEPSAGFPPRDASPVSCFCADPLLGAAASDAYAAVRLPRRHCSSGDGELLLPLQLAKFSHLYYLHYTLLRYATTLLSPLNAPRVEEALPPFSLRSVYAAALTSWAYRPLHPGDSLGGIGAPPGHRAARCDLAMLTHLLRLPSVMAAALWRLPDRSCPALSTVPPAASVTSTRHCNI